MAAHLLAPGLAPGLRRLGLDDRAWRQFVEAQQAATIFHHPAWAGVLAECYGYEPFALAVRDADGQVVAGLPVVEVRRPFGPRRWVSLPFTDSCAPLGAEEHGRSLGDGLAARLAHDGLRTIELRAELPPGSGAHVVEAAVRQVLPLDRPADALARGFSKMHQRNIRKAERGGLEVNLEHSEAAMDAFYRLHLLTRQRLGVPTQPKRFFDLLTARLIRPGLGFVLVARLAGQPLAAAVFLAWNGVLIYKYGASDARAWEHRPNNLLFWAAIRWACENGFHTFDWGRTDLEDRGLREFKSGWGAREEPLRYTIIGGPPPAARNGRIERAMGAVIRRSPPWVGRVLGELLYRYAA